MDDQSSVASRRATLSGFMMRIIETRRPSDRVILRVLALVVTFSALALAAAWSQDYVVTTPTRGGMLAEGMIGTPRFVNPVLAVTRADQDMTALLYSGLMKISPTGELVPDLAESVTVAEDGRTYNVLIRTDARWHDNTPLTARDVSFTIALLQNDELKSPLRGNWSGVTVEEIGEYELNIILDEPYTPFIENFTVGILPRHIWNELPIEQIPFSQLNTEPIGSGPYMIDRVTRNKSGVIDMYHLTRSTTGFYNPNIPEVVVRFYINEEQLAAALRAGEITSTVYASIPIVEEFAQNPDYTIVSEPLPRLFGIFFNQNRSIALRDTGARQALSAAVDREALIESVLGGYGVPTHQPVPPWQHEIQSTDQTTALNTDALARAQELLVAAGWRNENSNTWEKRIDGNLETLTVTIRSANSPLFSEAAESVANSWRSLGIATQIEQYEQTDLLQSVIRARDFQALLFGIDMSRTVDLYPFWHSSQREDPGLNIAQYANIEVDALLEEIRTTQDQDVYDAALQEILSTLDEEAPALFLFAPMMTYIVRSDITLELPKHISRPQERFMNISNWYVSTDTLWPMFRN